MLSSCCFFAMILIPFQSVEMMVVDKFWVVFWVFDKVWKDSGKARSIRVVRGFCSEFSTGVLHRVVEKFSRGVWKMREVLTVTAKLCSLPRDGGITVSLRPYKVLRTVGGCRRRRMRVRLLYL